MQCSDHSSWTNWILGIKLPRALYGSHHLVCVHRQVTQHVEVDELQQQKSMCHSKSLSQDEESSSTFGTSSPKLGSRKLEKNMVEWILILLWHADGRTIWLHQHELTDPSWLVSTIQAAPAGVMVWKCLFDHILHANQVLFEWFLRIFLLPVCIHVATDYGELAFLRAR